MVALLLAVFAFQNKSNKHWYIWKCKESQPLRTSMFFEVFVQLGDVWRQGALHSFNHFAISPKTWAQLPGSTVCFVSSRTRSMSILNAQKPQPLPAIPFKWKIGHNQYKQINRVVPLWMCCHGELLCELLQVVFARRTSEARHTAVNMLYISWTSSAHKYSDLMRLWCHRWRSANSQIKWVSERTNRKWSGTKLHIKVSSTDTWVWLMKMQLWESSVRCTVVATAAHRSASSAVRRQQ